MTTKKTPTPHPTALDVTYTPVAELHTYHHNPRHGATERIAKSLRVHGQYKPVVVNHGTHTGRTNEVLAGNHTLKAARDEGWNSLACTYIDVDDDEAARIVADDNHTSDLASNDNRLLAELLGDLPDLADTTFDHDELDAILRRAEPPDVSAFTDYDTDIADDTSDHDNPTTLTCPECGHQWTVNP